LWQITQIQAGFLMVFQKAQSSLPSAHAEVGAASTAETIAQHEVVDTPAVDGAHVTAGYAAPFVSGSLIQNAVSSLWLRCDRRD
jgi:hypothetical protein